MEPLPPGPFGAILCDYPWDFITYSRKRSIPTRAAGEQFYGSMTHEDGLKLPVGDVAAKDCVLFMWIMDSHLEHALALGKAWGFKYKTMAFVWDKLGMSMGHWTRKEGEFCLLFTKGKPKRLGKGVRQFIREAPREHSRKPEGQFGRVEALVGGPYLEMFAREIRPGWTGWGAQLGLFNGQHILKPEELGPLLERDWRNVDHVCCEG